LPPLFPSARVLSMERKCTLSTEFVSIADQEADRLHAAAAKLRAEADELIGLADTKIRQAVGYEGELRELDELLGRAPQLRIDLVDDELRGQRLAAVALELLVTRQPVGRPIHYRDWFRLVVESGHRVVGRNPLASFLTEIARSPLVEPAAPGNGVYRVDLEAAEARAESNVRQAETELAAAQVALESTPGDADRRTAVIAAKRRRTAAERRLGEVVTTTNRLRRQIGTRPSVA
jgi:hypothetical protein